MAKSSHIRRFARTMIAQAISAVGALGLTIIIGVIGGAKELGQFAVLTTLLGVLQIVARRGQNALLARATAWAEHKYDRRISRDLAFYSLRIIIVPSLFVGAAGSAILHLEVIGPPFPGAVIAFPFLLLIAVSLSVLAGYMRGTDRAWLSPLLENGGISLLAAIFLTPGLFFPDSSFELAALTAYGFSGAILLVTFIGKISVEVPLTSPHLGVVTELRGELERGQWAFMGIALGSYLVQAGSFILAAPFLTSEVLGYLRVSERLAAIVGFPALVVAPLMIPKLLPAIRECHSKQIRQIILFATFISVILGAIPSFVLFFFPVEILVLIGEEFAPSTEYLRVMALLQMVSASVTPIAMIITLAGHEKVSMYIHWAILIAAAICIPALSLSYGATGFLIALAVIILMRATLLATASYLVIKSIRIG